MNAPPFPLNPTVGEFFGNWTWNGARWVCSASGGVRIVTTLFTVAGPYMPAPGLTSLIVEAVGGGGPGGWASVDGTYVMGGGGGGSGGYSRKTLPASLVAGGVNVVVGQGGIGAAPYTLATATSFGALCIANGGGTGNPMNGQPGELGAGENGTGGPGAPPGVGDLALGGSDGWQGDFLVFDPAEFIQINSARGGELMGGSRTFNVNPGNGATGANGAAGSGAGGSGGVVNQATGAGNNMNGGDGGSGYCLVTEYCWGDAGDGDDCLNPPINVNARVAIVNEPWKGPGPCPPGWSGPYVDHRDFDD